MSPQPPLVSLTQTLPQPPIKILGKNSASANSEKLKGILVTIHEKETYIILNILG